ncbi:hypothetical protein HGG75_13070 [Ochrobactrum pseudogrignonense]|nr:hypothetical protein [Brucella pseudogrignonensis]
MGHHDLGASLARNGYIVVSVTHPGDNFKDPSRLGTVSSTYGRPMQISAALTAALDEAALAPISTRTASVSPAFRQAAQPASSLQVLSRTCHDLKLTAQNDQMIIASARQRVRSEMTALTSPHKPTRASALMS